MSLVKDGPHTQTWTDTRVLSVNVMAEMPVLVVVVVTATAVVSLQRRGDAGKRRAALCPSSPCP